MQFPWMMYRKGPGLDLPHGQRVSCQAAHDETEYAAAMAAGWFPSVPEALAEKLGPPGEMDAASKPKAATPTEAPTESGQPANPPARAPFVPEVGEQTKRGPGRPRKA